MTLMASIKTYEFEGLFYPITFLRASDKAMESAECVDIIDENTIISGRRSAVRSA